MRNEKIDQRLNRIFDRSFEHYTVSIRFNTVVKPRFKATFLTKVQEISPLIREVIVKTQLFMNYYIIINCREAILNRIFTENFWYNICLVIGCRMLPEDCQEKHSSVPNFVPTYNDFLVQFPTSIKPIGAIRGYAQCLSAACVMISTTYTSYYVETYQGKFRKYLIYKLSVKFPEIASCIIKRIVDDYALL
ncbi:hypothetical protein EDC94DRAFT_179276 [Helicostylum pulchrum]|nr:hypothetical protein EDC94DRAFT_179276 [Helicostylum pulchrum]